MNIACGKNQFVEAVTLTERLVGKKESLPVLSCILLVAEKNTLTLTATNLEAGVEIRIPAKVDAEGVAAIPAHTLSSVVRMGDGEKIEIKKEEANVSIRIGKTYSVVKTIPPEEFPPLPHGDGEKKTIEKKIWKEGIGSVAIAAAHSTIRPEFASVFITEHDNTLTFVATDSFRLAEKKIPTTSTGIPDTLLPVKNALELSHILEKTEDATIDVVIDDGQLSVEVGTVRFVSRIVDASFPNYTSIIPTTFVTEAVLLKADFANTLKRAKFFSHTNQHIGFHMYPAKKICSFTASHQDVGEVSDTLDAALSGNDLDINFNITYLYECIHTIPTDSVALRFAGAGKPLVVQGVGDNTYTYLVMPLNR